MDFLLNGFLEAFRLLFSGDEETYSAIRATLYTSSVSIFFANTSVPFICSMPASICSSP